ncbi:DUF3363 domain-containing protein [Burkholderia gladioli]|uniref:DUF3363 domain-containing protein n=1 Tax=Burkholderia gladioli TaxID=28095 RepID=UPI002363CA6F|nr:DUF3363 domain-containing protein [Burkholderia gladioli]MDD1786469.1 DUF3363 domain-containing protein [Burkholderia gladioli]
MQQHVDFLAERGLAEQRGPCVILARNLLGTLRSRELMRAAKDIAADTGLEHRLLAASSTWPASYREGSSTIARSCWQRTRYAILDDSTGLSLVPWRPVIEQRLVPQLAAAGCHGRPRRTGGSSNWIVQCAIKPDVNS